MKKYLLLVNVSITMVNIACMSNQKPQTNQSDAISAIQTDTISTDEDAIQFLREFYIAYNRAWKEPDDAEKLYNLQQKYCSRKFRKELKEAFKIHGLDHDVLTADYGIDYGSIKTLLITKNDIKENTYCVSYIIDTQDAANKNIKRNVQIQLVLVKEDGDFKIDAVLNPYSGICN